MSRKSYLNASKPEKMCRVCFTQSSLMFNLTKDMDLENAGAITLLDALEKVVSAKIIINEDLSECICPMCISILKMSYKFVTQFEATQIKLSKKTGIYPTYEPIINLIQPKESDKLNVVPKLQSAPVEIIFGEQKFNLKDILIVEEAQKEQSNFKGFLENLGQEVSATFTDKSKSKSCVEKQNDAVSIYMALNDDSILPVKELKIDDDTNTIDCIVLEEDDLEEPTGQSGQIEYIETESQDMDVEQFILQIENESNDKNKENKTTETEPEIKKPTKRKKSIEEKIIDGFILMEPIENEKVQKANLENDDDLFEREIQYPCELCKKIFPTKRSLRAHVKRIHFRQPIQYTCEICGHQNNTLSGHMHHKVKHKGKQFVCEICSKTYYTRAVLKVHMATHVNKRQHLCNVCGKGFNYPNALVYHMRLHTGEKKYKCEYCGEKFRMPNALKRHERTHTGERPYKCSFCDRAFCSKGEVQCHETIHTGYRPYHCKHCWKGFTKTHNLKLHLLSHDGPHKCDICGKSFIEMGILATHFKIAHKDVLEKEAATEEDTNF